MAQKVRKGSKNLHISCFRVLKNAYFRSERAKVIIVERSESRIYPNRPPRTRCNRNLRHSRCAFDREIEKNLNFHATNEKMKTFARKRPIAMESG